MVYPKRKKKDNTVQIFAILFTVMAISLMYALAPSGPSIRASSSISASADPIEETTAEPTLDTADLESTKAYPDVSEDASQSEIMPDLPKLNPEEIVKRNVPSDDAPQSIFEDFEEFENAPTIKIDKSVSKKLHVRALVTEHREFYASSPRKLYVPRLRKEARISNQEFVRRFVLNSQPVIIPFEAMRHLGFTMKSYTLDELLDLYPNHGNMIYKFGPHLSNEELDLGPALSVLKRHEPLKFTKKGRNFPRNTKVRHWSSLSTIGLQGPPYRVPDTGLLSPALWFGTEGQPTVFHADCCDNYAFMVMGTKRWTISPPSEALILKPNCKGGLCWVKSLPHPDEHAEGTAAKALAKKLQSVTFDLRPGEMLYLPTGWFHHVENVGATIMVNYWTKGGPGFQRAMRGEFDEWLKEENPEVALEMEKSLDNFGNEHESITSSTVKEDIKDQMEEEREEAMSFEGTA